MSAAIEAPAFVVTPDWDAMVAEYGDPFAGRTPPDLDEPADGEETDEGRSEDIPAADDEQTSPDGGCTPDAEGGRSAPGAHDGTPRPAPSGADPNHDSGAA